MDPFSWSGSHLSLVCPVVMLVLPVHEIPPEARWVYVEVPDDFWDRTVLRLLWTCTVLRHLTIRPCLDVVVLLLARGGMVFLFSLSCAKCAPALNHSVSNSVKVRRQRNEWKNRGFGPTESANFTFRQLDLATLACAARAAVLTSIVPPARPV